MVALKFAAGRRRRPRQFSVWHGVAISVLRTGDSKQTSPRAGNWLASCENCGCSAFSSPYWEDAHPDHVAASALIDAARFWAKLTKSDLPGSPHYPDKIIYYFSIHLRLRMQPSFVLDVSAHLDTKMKALDCYRSQFLEGRPTTPPTIFDDVRDQSNALLGLDHRRPVRRTISDARGSRPARAARLAVNLVAAV